MNGSVLPWVWPFSILFERRARRLAEKTADLLYRYPALRSWPLADVMRLAGEILGGDPRLLRQAVSSVPGDSPQ